MASRQLVFALQRLAMPGQELRQTVKYERA